MVKETKTNSLGWKRWIPYYKLFTARRRLLDEITTAGWPQHEIDNLMDEFDKYQPKVWVWNIRTFLAFLVPLPFWILFLIIYGVGLISSVIGSWMVVLGTKGIGKPFNWLSGAYPSHKALDKIIKRNKSGKGI